MAAESILPSVEFILCSTYVPSRMGTPLFVSATERTDLKIDKKKNRKTKEFEKSI